MNKVDHKAAYASKQKTRVCD